MRLRPPSATAGQRRKSPTTIFLSKGPSFIRFENFKPPALNQPLAEIEVEGLHLDLHRHLRLVGLTFGIEPTSATLGWAAVEPLHVVRGAQALPVSGLALHFTETTRFEIAFERDPPGQLDYFELLRDPELNFRFFFEGGTVRIAAKSCRAELIAGGDDDEGSRAGEDIAGRGSGLLQ